MKDEIFFDEQIPINERISFFYEKINDFVEQGYGRNDIYKFVNMVLNNNLGLPEELTDAVYEFKTKLIGDAAPSSMFRFEGEPIDDDELAQYVRSYVWMKDDESD